MFCGKCGKAIPEGGKFCLRCGAPVYQGAVSQGAVSQGAAAPPPPVPPHRRHPALIPGIVTTVIIVAAGLGLGLYFGINSDYFQSAGKTAGATVTADATTVPSATPPPGAATDSATAALAARAAAWMDLLESIRVSGQDRTAEIAAFLTPKDQAGARAALYQTDWSTPPGPLDIIETNTWGEIASVLLDPDGSRAVTIGTLKLVCRDRLTTRGLEALSWKLDGGEWLRTVEHAPLTPVAGPLVPFGSAIRVGTILWSPETIHELKHLGEGEGPTAAGMFMTVEFFVENEGRQLAVPSDYQVTAVDKTGTEYTLSPKGEAWWSGDVEDRSAEVDAGDSSYLWYTFDIPTGLDLQSVQFRIMLPTV